MAGAWILFDHGCLHQIRVVDPFVIIARDLSVYRSNLDRFCNIHTCFMDVYCLLCLAVASFSFYRSEPDLSSVFPFFVLAAGVLMLALFGRTISIW